jgi:hypothetical protein
VPGFAAVVGLCRKASRLLTDLGFAGVVTTFAGRGDAGLELEEPELELEEPELELEEPELELEEPEQELALPAP